jgi:hypothetical protein
MPSAIECRVCEGYGRVTCEDGGWEQCPLCEGDGLVAPCACECGDMTTIGKGFCSPRCEELAYYEEQERLAEEGLVQR